jgi:hypothetical protein
MPEFIDVWIETPAQSGHLPSDLRKLHIVGETLVSPTHPFTDPVGVFRAEGGELVIFQRDGKLLGSPNRSLSGALGSAPLGQELQANIRLLCEWPDDPAAQKRLFDASSLDDGEIRDLRLAHIEAETWTSG